MQTKTRILIIDAHPLIREGFKSIIGRQARFELIGEADRGEDGLRLAEELHPDLVVMEISLPDINGLDLTRRLSRQAPASRILIVSIHDGIDYVSEAFRAGARGYMVKAASLDHLIQGLEAVAAGEYFMDRVVSYQVVRQMITATPPKTQVTDARYETLTPREKEVTRLLVAGLSIKEIGAQLFISPKTVENHRTNLMNKMGFQSTLDLIKYAVKHDLVDPDQWKQ